MRLRLSTPRRALAVTVAVASALFVAGVPLAAAEPGPPGSIDARAGVREVILSGWPAGSTVRIAVAGQSVDTAVPPDGSGAAAWYDVTLPVGEVVTVDVLDGDLAGTHGEMTVGPVAVAGVDYDADVVSGVALPTVTGEDGVATLVQVCVGWQPDTGLTEGTCRWVPTLDTVDDPSLYGIGTSTSTWSADFSEPALDRYGELLPAFDLVPYWQGMEVSQLAPPVDVTLPEDRTSNQPEPFPYLDVQFNAGWDPPASGKVVAYGYDVGSVADFTLVKDGSVTCEQSTQVQPAGQDAEGWDHWLPYALFDPWAGDGTACSPVLGDRLTVTGSRGGAPLTKELTVVAPLRSDGSVGVDADVAADRLAGVVPAGFDVEVGPWDGASLKVPVADGVDTFLADLSLADPPYDVQPWSWFGIQVFDPDGDVVDTQLRAQPQSFTVDPVTELVDGQVVTASGEAFLPGTVTLAQGAGFIGGIDFGTALEVEVAADGTFVSAYPLQRVINVPPDAGEEPVATDCATRTEAEGPCFVVALSDPDSSYVSTFFRAPTVELSLGATGQLTKASGRVTVTGAVVCDPLDAVLVEGTLWQRVSRKALATGTFSTVVACSAGTWSAVVTPSGTIPFGTGTAELSATATLMVGGWDITDEAVRIIRVRLLK